MVIVMDRSLVFSVGFLAGLLVMLGIFSNIPPLEVGAIAHAKGEIVCQYNDFADKWYCKETGDE